MNEIIISRACPPDCLEKARIEERRKIGEWLEEHVMGAILADMQGYDFKVVIENLKRGEEVK